MKTGRKSIIDDLTEPDKPQPVISGERMKCIEEGPVGRVGRCAVDGPDVPRLR